MTTFRLVTPQDAEDLCHLNNLFNGPGTILEDVQNYLESDHREIIAVAQVDKTLVGFACAQVIYTFYEAQPIAEITELYVLPEHRNRGIATQLLQFLEHYCAETFHVSEFKLLTGKENFTAQKFYEKSGYQQEDEILYSK